jgi:hypothetical protein
MKELGRIIYKLLKMCKKNRAADYDLLERVFNEQYSVGKRKEIDLLEKEKISSKSVQSIHDTDCTYRNKDGNKVKGYSVNLTETCDEGEDNLNLVTDVNVKEVTTPDTNFLKPAVEKSQDVVVDKTEEIYADGAYHSVDNQAYCKDEDIELFTTNMQGKESRYDLTFDETTEELIVKDKKTDKIIPARKVASRKDKNITKWVIKTQENKPRYFTQKDIECSLLRRKISQTPRDKLNIRNNVEATIFQFGYHYPNDKTRYRTLCKHKMWASVRVMGINFKRILKFITKTGKETCFIFDREIKMDLENLCLMFIIIHKYIFTNKIFPTFNLTSKNGF